MSVQNYETDVLQEHVDSTPILIERLEQWSKGVHIIQEYVHGYVQVHQGISHNLEKTLKNLGEVPSFPEIPVAEGQDPAVKNSSLANVFQNLQTNTNLLLQRSVATANGIKTSIVPQLDQIVEEIDKHYKTLRTQGGKGIKDIEKSREHTQRQIEHLGRVSSSFGSRQLSYHDDPFILHRRVQAAISDQVGRENTQAEAALNVQKSFASLETHIMQTLRHSLATLSSLNDGYDNSEREVNDTITGLFKSVDLDNEWAVFTKTNAQQLVPSTNYQRDPDRVTFVNKNHQSTQPLIAGVLSRKTTMLKNWNQAYYAVTPSGYLHQLKSPDPQVEPAPELSLFLPECQLSKSTKPGESIFKIVGKDTQKKIGPRHKYVFKTTSPRELDQWYNVIARITGNIADDNDSEVDAAASSPQSPSQSQPQSPVPPTAAFANTTLDDRPPASPASPLQSGAASPVQASNAAAFGAAGAATAGAPAVNANAAAAAAPVSHFEQAPPNYQPSSGGFQHAAGGFQQPAAGNFQQPAAGNFQQPAAGNFQQPAPGGFQQPAAGGFQQAPVRQATTAAPANAQAFVPNAAAQQAGPSGQAWGQASQIKGDEAARNSYLSANDPFKSF